MIFTKLTIVHFFLVAIGFLGLGSSQVFEASDPHKQDALSFSGDKDENKTKTDAKAA